VGLRILVIRLVVAALFAAMPTLAQADDSVRLRGTIVSLADDALVVKTSEGVTTKFKLADDVLITENEPSDVAAIKPGDFVASAAVRGDDGNLHSTDLRIFPEALRGIGEGQRPMQDAGKTMTNAAVAKVVSAAEGQILIVNFKGGSDRLLVGPGVPVIKVVIAGREALVPGLNVFVFAIKAADGTLTAKRILAM
jgi:hypothetical protein